MESNIVVGSALLLLAVAHSFLGEARIVRSVLAAEIDFGMPERVGKKIVRFAWHLPSLAWLGIGLEKFGLPDPLVLLIVAGVPGVLLLVILRSHLAWPVFLLASLAAMNGAGWLSPLFLGTMALLTAGVLAIAAALHLFWALGGRVGMTAALPEVAGKPAFVPGRLMTALVAMLLAGFAGAIALAVLGPASMVVDGLLGLGIAGCIARAIGDGRYVGFTKRLRSTTFARRDDLYFTPLVVLFAFGTTAGLVAT